MEAISRPSMGSEVSEDAAQYESLKINKYGDAAEVTSLSGPGRNGKTDFLLPTRLPVAIMPSPAVALRPCRSAIVDGKILERASQACLRENS
jgi:hypothetical protein